MNITKFSFLKIKNINYNLLYSKIYKILYKQDNITDYRSLKIICKCFHLFFDDDHNPKGLYKGLLR